MKYAVVITVGLAAGLLAAPEAHAYLDPGTGSILLQGLIAVVVGGLFVLRAWWGRIKAFFKKTPEGSKVAAEEGLDTRRDVL